MTVAEALRRGAATLRRSAIDSPRLEARLLLADALGVGQADLLRDTAMEIDTSVFDALLVRRVAHEPMAYILGHQGFWSLDFLVSPATLIPRADSETVVEAALAAAPGAERVLDLGTGTGCLLLSVLHERPGAFGVGVDVSPEAAAVARENARRLGLVDRAEFLCGNWADALGGRFDLVVANPPYIEHAAIPGLMPDVADHEPTTALDGGPDGLDAYRAIIRKLPGLLGGEGIAVLELGIGQAQAVASLGRRHGLAARFRTDLAGIDRAIILRRA